MLRQLSIGVLASALTFAPAPSRAKDSFANKMWDVMSVSPKSGVESIIESLGKVNFQSTGNSYSYPNKLNKSAKNIKKKILTSVVSIREFGAIGDGKSDDTDFIQAALDSDADAIVIPKGDYVVSKTLTSSKNNRAFYGPGSLTSNTKLNQLIEITGSRNKISLNIKGNRRIENAIKVIGGANEIANCVISDLYSPYNSGSAIAISVNLNQPDEGVTIKNNKISNIKAVGDKTGANRVGMSRAILVRAARNLKSPITIQENTIESIVGEEGDAVVVINSNRAGKFFTAPLLISNNTIRRFTRRGIKIQSSGARISNNYIRNYWLNDRPSFQSVIDLVQGDDHRVIGNNIVDCRFLAQIKVNSRGKALHDIVISNNIIKGVGSETTVGNLIFLKTLGTGLVVENNIIITPGYRGNAIKIISTKKRSIRNNIIETSGKDYSVITR